MIWDSALRQLTRRPGRTLLSLVSVVIAVGAIVSANVATEVTRAAYKNLFSALAGRADLEVTSRSGGLFRQQVAEPLRGLPGVRAVTPALYRFTNLQTGDKKVKVLVSGIDVDQPDTLSGFKLASGEWPSAAGQLAVETEFAQSLNLKLGDEVQLRSYQGLLPQTIVGLVTVEDVARLQQGGTLVAPIAMLQRSFRSAGEVTGLQLFLEPAASPDQVIAAAAPLLPTTLDIHVPAARTGLADEALALSNNGLNLAGGLAFLTAVVIVLNMFLMNVGERRRELSILRALGGTRRQILGMVCIEALLLGLVGTGLGIGLGLVGGHILTQSLTTMLQTSLPAASPKWSLLLGAVIGPLICLVAALHPARIASRVSPLEGMRPRVTLVPRRVHRVSVASGVIGVAISSTIGIYCMLGLAPIWLAIIDVIFGLLSLSLLLPVFLAPGIRLLSWPLQPLLRLEGEISRRLVERYSGRSALTIGVLFIAIAAAVAVSNVVFSIADDVRNWYHRTIAVDFLVRTMMPDMTGQETASMPESLGTEIAALDGVKMVDPLRHVAALVGNQNAQLVARDFQRYDVLPLMVPESESREILDRLRQGEAVLGSVLAEKTGLKVGDTVNVTVQEKTESMRVAAIISEYTFGGAVVILDRSVASRLFSMEGVDAYLIAAKAPMPDSLAANLRTIADREGLLLQTNSELLRIINGTINGIVSGLWILLLLVLLIGALGMVNTLTMNVLEQTRELGMLRAMGLKRGQIIRTVLGQAAYMGLLGIISGGLAGLAMARIFNICMGSLFGHAVAFVVRPQWILLVLVLGLSAVLTAALLPAFRAARLNPVEAMRST